MTNCAYCNELRELCASHAIPDGFFKAISRKNNGKLITIPSGEGSVHLSQETGKSKLLCSDCERLFNRKFDSPIVNALKAWDRKIAQQGFGTGYEFSPNQMAQSLASIFWRASVSGNDMYANAKVSRRDMAALLSIVRGEQEQTLKFCSCSIKRLFDKRSASNGGFSQEVISQIILPVNAYRISWGQKKPTSYFAFVVIMQGFLCYLTIPRLPHRKRTSPEFLSPLKNQLRAPRQHLLDYQPLLDVMVAGMGKHLDGFSTLKD